MQTFSVGIIYMMCDYYYFFAFDLYLLLCTSYAVFCVFSNKINVNFYLESAAVSISQF